jgi:hypothetical protein
MASTPSALTPQPAPTAKSPLPLVLSVVALLIALVAVATVVSPLRQAILEPILGVTPTTAPAVVEKPGSTPTSLPSSGQVATAASPATAPTPRTATQAPIVVTATPQAITPTPLMATPTPRIPTQTPAPTATLTPNQRLARIRDTFEAGNHSSALAMLVELRQSNPALTGLDDAEYDIRMSFARTLLDRGDTDGAYEQFGGALKVRKDDAAAKRGQEQIILAKNYATMEASWGKDDDAAIAALEQNMVLDPGYRETRSKLYALLIMKADRLVGAGERDAAFPILMRALEVFPDAGEAQRRLVSYTPTAVPTATPQPARAPVVQPQPQPQPQQPQPQQPRPQPQPQPPPQQPLPTPCPGNVCF